MSATMLLTKSALNPDEDFVLHGRSASYNGRDDILRNSQLTNTTSRLSQHSIYNPDNYKEKKRIYARSMTDMAQNLEYMSDKLDRTLSKSVTFRPDADGGDRLFKYTLTAIPNPDTVIRTRRPEMSDFKEPAPGETLTTTIPDENLIDMYEKHIGEIDSLSGKPVSPRDSQWYVNPNHLDSMVDAPTLQTLGRTDMHRRDRSQKTFSDRDMTALENFPVTFGSAYEMRGEGFPEPAKLRRSQNVPLQQFKKEHTVDQLHLLAAEVPTVGTTPVYLMTPYQSALGRLRLERLQLEEAKLLELKRLEELERIRGPKTKWYESKGPEFHYEAHKNTEMMKNQCRFQELFDYREDLLRSSYTNMKKYNKMLYAE